jgi:O-antigen ligase
LSRERFWVAYTRAAAVVTMAFYTAGHAAAGFPLFLVGNVVRVLSGRPPLWRRSVLDAPLAAFGLVLVVSALASDYRAITMPSMILTVVSGVALFGPLAWLVGRDPGIRPLLLRVWALGGPPAAVVGLVAGWMARDRAFFPRMPMGTNAFGTTLFLASLVALGLAYRAEGRGRRLWFACALVTLAGLLATESRSALAGWLLGGTYLTWRELRDRPRQLALVLAAAFAVLVFVAAAAPSVGARVGHASTDLVEDRLQIWRTSVDLIRAHPLLGTGPGTFQTVFNRRKPPNLERKWSAHNLWLHYAVETGLVGLAALLWAVFAAGREWVRVGRRPGGGADPLRPVITALALGLVVDQCGDNTLLSVSTITGAWLVLALLVTPAPVPGTAAEQDGRRSVRGAGGGARRAMTGP